MRKHFSLHQFETGLTVVMELIPETVSAAVGFLVKTGARDEAARYDGVSHFLEHMMFKGTRKRGWLEINRDFDLMGARYNAFTGLEETCYYGWVLKEEIPKALELLSDMLAPTLPPDEFVSEKKVILEEIARYRDMPDHVAFEEVMRIAFRGQRLASNVLGTRQTVSRLTRGEMQDYFNARYVPANITLFACGNIDEAAILAQVDELWGERTVPLAPRQRGEGLGVRGRTTDRRPLTPNPSPLSGARGEQPRFVRGRKLVARKGIAREHMVVLWPSVALTDRQDVAAGLLGAILGDDENSRLYWALRHTGLAEEAGGGYWGLTDTGVMVVHASCDPAKAKQVLGILRGEAGKLKRGIRPAELQRVKNRLRTALVFAAETPFNRFRQLMQQWHTRRELLTTAEMLARVDAVKLKDLYELLERFPMDGAGALAALGPLKKLEGRRQKAEGRSR